MATQPNSPMGKGAPNGNTNAKRGALMRKLIEEVLEEPTDNSDDTTPGAPKTTKKKRKLVRKLVEMALAGDMKAISEVLDRVDGKAAQSVALTGADDGPLILRVTALDESL